MSESNFWDEAAEAVAAAEAAPAVGDGVEEISSIAAKISAAVKENNEARLAVACEELRRFLEKEREGAERYSYIPPRADKPVELLYACEESKAREKERMAATMADEEKMKQAAYKMRELWILRRLRGIVHGLLHDAILAANCKGDWDPYWKRYCKDGFIEKVYPDSWRVWQASQFLKDEASSLEEAFKAVWKAHKHTRAALSREGEDKRALLADLSSFEDQLLGALKKPEPHYLQKHLFEFSQEGLAVAALKMEDTGSLLKQVEAEVQKLLNELLESGQAVLFEEAQEFLSRALNAFHCRIDGVVLLTVNHEETRHDYDGSGGAWGYQNEGEWDSHQDAGEKKYEAFRKMNANFDFILKKIAGYRNPRPGKPAPLTATDFPVLGASVPKVRAGAGGP
jgi:hypothetical protein